MSLLNKYGRKELLLLIFRVSLIANNNKYSLLNESIENRFCDNISLGLKESLVDTTLFILRILLFCDILLNFF